MVKADNKDILNKKITGQYVQKEFILDIASWISPAFYFKCSKIVNYFFIELYKKDLDLKDQQLKEANERADEYKEMALDFQTLAVSNCKLEQTSPSSCAFGRATHGLNILYNDGFYTI
jgi:hypothetical protein